jgi:hypothetical protein
MANQFTPNALRKKPRLDPEEHRRAIQVGVLIKRLSDCANGKIEMNSNQIAAAKALIDKAVPTLSAVETTQLEAAAVSTEAEILEQLTALIRANPSLMSEIQGQVARQANGEAVATAKPLEANQFDNDRSVSKVLDISNLANPKAA